MLNKTEILTIKKKYLGEFEFGESITH